MKSLKHLFPLPHTCQHEAYQEGVRDAHRNPLKSWAVPTPRNCVWWTPAASEIPHAPIGGDRVRVDLVLVLDESVSVDHRDRFRINGQPYEVIGLPQDYNHGPFGVSPGRLVVELRWTG